VEANYDFIKVYSGESNTGPLLETATGQRQTLSVENANGILFVEFASDGSVQATGFLASYTSALPSPGSTPAPIVTGPTLLPVATLSPIVDERCSGTVDLTDATGSLSDGSGQYQSDSTCLWRINAPGPITLTFSSVQLESNYDFVKVYAGLSVAAPIVETITGTRSAVTVSTMTSQLLVVFSSDSSVNGNGFEASYTSGASLEPAETPVPVLDAQTAVPLSLPTVACSGSVTLTSLSGSISDGPGAYLSNSACSWLINAAGPVTLTFDEVNLEANYDFVKVYSGASASAPLALSLTGQRMAAESVSSASGQLYVVFSSDASVQDSGFQATYRVSTSAPVPTAVPVAVSPPIVTPAVPSGAPTAVQRCSGTVDLSAPSATFSDGSGPYASDAACSWRITNNNAGPIILTFTGVSLEANYDFIKVYDGTSTGSPLVRTITGAPTSPTVVTGASGTLFVSFTTDASVNGGGFEASYITPGQGLPATATPAVDGAGSQQSFPRCDNEAVSILSDSSGYFSDGDGPYSTNSFCQWRIDAGSPVTINFETVEMEQNYDFIRVFDGPDASSPLLKDITGTGLQSVTSSGGSIYVMMTSDNSVNGEGFVARYALSQRRRPATVSTLTESSKSSPLLPIAAGLVVVLVASLTLVFLVARAHKRQRSKPTAKTASQVTVAEQPHLITPCSHTPQDTHDDAGQEAAKHDQRSMIWT
jgi:hypothetical protein